MFNKFLDKKHKSDCYGCGMCTQKCPAEAINMVVDEEGFQYPQIDKAKCVSCGVCASVCPINMEEYEGKLGPLRAVVHKDKDIVKDSQTGGAFTAFSDVILQQNGVVYGAVVQDDLTVAHIRANNELNRNKMRGSKYVQSYISQELLDSLQRDLAAGKMVLFSGTPCQCAGIKKVYGKYENLYIMDFLCHGVASPKLWQDFLDMKQSEIGQIKEAVFRCGDFKNMGLHTERLFDSEGQEHISNTFAACYYTHCANRPACYSCQYASEKRYSDITVGGFLDTDLLHIDYSLGASMVFLNSEKGQALWKQANVFVKSEEVPFQKFKQQPCLYKPIQKPDLRKSFWQDYKHYGISYMCKKYATNEIKRKFHIEIPEEAKPMNEREEKYQIFKENDLQNNRGLIVNQLDEVRTMMDYPIFTKSFREGYLNSILSYAVENTEFYRKQKDFRSLQDFPLVNKEILKEHYDEIFVSAFQGRSDNKEKRTSGTTGTPFTIYWDHRKHCRMIADVKYFAEMGGAVSHERIVCLIVTEKGDRKPLELQERDNVYNVYCGYFDDASIEKILLEANSHKPKIIIGYGSMWKAIANYIYEGKAAALSWNVSSILSEAEALDGRSKEILAEYFNCPVYSRYGNEENGVLAQEDESGLGHRFNTASYYIEILKLDKDEPAEDGEIGRVVLTDLFNYAFPMIRYENGDLAVKNVIDDGKIYLSSVLGRQIDMLYTTDGRAVNWLAGVIFLKKYKDIKQFQIVQESETEYTWVLNTLNHSYEDIIIKESKEIFGDNAKIQIKYVDEIPRLQSGKTKMTVCKLKK